MLLSTNDLLFGDSTAKFENKIVIHDYEGVNNDLVKHFESKYLSWCNELREHLKKSIVKYKGNEDTSSLVRYLKIRLLDNEGNMVNISSTSNIEGVEINRFPGEPVSLDVDNATATIDFQGPIRILGMNATDTLTIDSSFPNYQIIMKDFRNLYKLTNLVDRCSEYASNSIVSDDPNFNPIREYFSDYINSIVQGTYFESISKNLLDSMMTISESDTNNLISPKNIAAYILAEEIIDRDYGLDFFDMYRSTNEFINVIEKEIDEVGNTGNLIEFLEDLIKAKSFTMDNQDTFGKLGY